MVNTLDSSNVWQQNGETFWPSTTALNTKKIPPAIYRYGTTPDGRWFLEKTASKYVFPYKIYGCHDGIIERVKKAWYGLPSNFGVLLNGLKGTGKTITAQMIVNWAIDEGLVVLNVSSPLPLAMIMEHVEQPMLVLFDEFEKTHNEEKDHQQHILSAIDGLSRSEHRRLFLFTTNTKKVNDNLIDRPSRIRYSWEFDRVGPEMIEMVMDDLLDKKLTHLRTDILTYLNTRVVLTIDVVKTVINEVNIFKESPTVFENFMNLTKKEPGAFRVEIVDELGGTLEVSSYFKCTNGAWLQGMMTKAGRKAFIEQYTALNRTASIHNTYGQSIELLGPTDKDDEWICHVQMSAFKTWIGKSPKLSNRTGSDYLWLDDKPKDWKMPEWAKKIESGAEMNEEEEDEYNDWYSSDTIFGSDKKKKVRVRFTLDNEPYKYNYRSMLADGNDY